MQKIRNIAIAAMVMMLLTSHWAAAQAMNHVSADVLFFVKIKNVQQVSQKFSQFTTELGIAQLVPPLMDPVGTLKAQAGVNEGLREDGDLIFAYLDPTSTGVDEDRSVIFLLPVSDYEAFLGNFEGVETEDGISQFTPNGGGQPAFAAKWGEYAALSPARELVTQQPAAAVAVQGLAARQLDSQDAVAYANFEKISAIALPQLRENRAKILEEVSREVQNNPQQQRFAPVINVAVERALDIAEAFLEDARSATWSITIGEKGLNSTWTAEFKPDTYGARALGQLKGTNDPLINDLPEGQYLMYAGSAIDPQLTTRLFDDLLNPIVTALGQVEGADAATAARFVDAVRNYYGASSSQSWGMLAPAGALGAESLVQSVVVARGDSQRMKTAQRDMFAMQTELMQVFSGEGGQEVTIEYTENAATVGDVQFDRFTTDVKVDPDTPQAAQAQQALQMIYGPGGLGGYTAVVDGKLVTASGLTEERLQEVVDAARAGKSLVAGKAHIEAVDAELPAQRVMVSYLPLDQWVTTGAAYAAQFGLPVQVQLPPDLPPIGMTVTGEGEALRFDLHLPTDLLQSLVAAGMQAALGQMGPGGGGGL